MYFSNAQYHHSKNRLGSRNRGFIKKRKLANIHDIIRHLHEAVDNMGQDRYKQVLRSR